MFVCFSTKAVHISIIDLRTNALIAAFKRFDSVDEGYAFKNY